MRLSQFHDWLKSLPSEFDGYPVAFCDATEVDGEFRMQIESQYMVSIEIDDDHQEIVLRHENNTAGVEMTVWNLGQLRSWSASAPERQAEYSCVIGDSWFDHATLLWGRLDRIVDACDVDEEAQEVVIASIRDPDSEIKVIYE